MLEIAEPCMLEENRYYFRQIGPLRLWMFTGGGEWLLSSDRLPKEKNISTAQMLPAAPQQRTWTRHIMPDNETAVTLQPATPDRSVVVKPEVPLKIASGADIRIFILLPLWIRIMIGNRQPRMLAEIPSQILQNTWFGEPHEGELCYYLKTWAKRSLDGLEPLPHWVACPIHIRNISSSDLDFTRICIRTGFLSIYKGATWLWTDQVHVQFRGVNQSSRIRYEHSVPAFEPACALVGNPRRKPSKEFTLKTFDTFNLLIGN